MAAAGEGLWASPARVAAEPRPQGSPESMSHLKKPRLSVEEALQVGPERVRGVGPDKSPPPYAFISSPKYVPCISRGWP